jgi:hypothetical protein
MRSYRWVVLVIIGRMGVYIVFLPIAAWSAPERSDFERRAVLRSSANSIEFDCF